jgi:hypothetical protein
MSKLGRAALGLFTALPLIYILGLLFVFRDFSFDVIQRLHFAMMAIYLVVVIWYERNVTGNERVPPEKRALWAALLLVGSSIAQLVYFYHYVWRDDLIDESMARM